MRTSTAGEEAGVDGTPAFFINGRMLSGAQPFEAFKRIIDEELARQKTGTDTSEVQSSEVVHSEL